MLQHPNFDPIALQLGPISIHWYGLMYLFGFAAAWLLGRYRIRQGSNILDNKGLEDLIFYCVLGVIIGGRLGFIIFYDLERYIANPMFIFFIWEGGMAFHGGLIGVIAAIYLYAKKHNKKLLDLADFIAPLVPLGLAAGRLGNFINGELWGRASDMPWAMTFINAGDNISRHPSQIYEMLLEGLFLFALLWWFSNTKRKTGQVSGMFLTGYGLIRFLVEFTREPDAHLGLLIANLSMGQLLSIPMIAVGLVLIIRPANK